MATGPRHEGRLPRKTPGALAAVETWVVVVAVVVLVVVPVPSAPETAAAVHVGSYVVAAPSGRNAVPTLAGVLVLGVVFCHARAKTWRLAAPTFPHWAVDVSGGLSWPWKAPLTSAC